MIFVPSSHCFLSFLKTFCFLTFPFLLLLVWFSLGKPGPNGEVNMKQNYATWDARKSMPNGQGPMYDEIPYGDGPGPRGPIPELPQHYAQVPKVPQRQGF